MVRSKVFCPICGTEIKNPSAAQKFCSDECRRKNKMLQDAWIREIKASAKASADKIIQINREARAAGMTYGKYVGLMRLKKEAGK